MACGDNVIMFDGTGYVKVPAGPFVRDRFYSGKTLSECFDDFKKEYGRCGFRPGEPFSPLRAAAMIRRDWYQLKKSNHLPPGEEGVTLDALLDRPRTGRREEP